MIRLKHQAPYLLLLLIFILIIKSYIYIYIYYINTYIHCSPPQAQAQEQVHIPAYIPNNKIARRCWIKSKAKALHIHTARKYKYKRQPTWRCVGDGDGDGDGEQCIGRAHFPLPDSREQRVVSWELKESEARRNRAEHLNHTYLHTS